MSEMEQMESALLESLEAIYGKLEFSIIDLLRQVSAYTPDKVAIWEIDRTSLTYSGLLGLATKTVSTLHALGLPHGSRVAIALSTTAESAAAYISIMAGMTLIPIGSGLPADEYERYLRHERADAVVVRQDLPSDAREVAKRLGIPAIELVYEVDGPVGMFEIAGSRAFDKLEPGFAQPSETAVILPTSGTTALPKLVPWSQRDLAVAAYFGLSMFQLMVESPYPVFGIMPLQHASGFGLMMRALYGKVGFVCVPGGSVDQIFRYLAFYRPASTLVVPALLRAMVDEAHLHSDEMSQFHLKRITVVSAALPEQLLRKAQRVFGLTVQTMYGMSEILSIAGAERTSESPIYAPGFVGQPLPFCRVQVTDEAGTPLPAGQTGEVRLLSPRLFKGYEDNPEANMEAFRDGWFRTGDAGHLDAEGNLYLTGRVKEMINRGGSKVTPLDVDAVLLEHPGVAEVATFSFPHSALGEDVAAAVVVTDPNITERELRSFAAKRLAMYKVPSRFVFVSQIPKTSAGKIKRLSLTEQFKAELER